MRHIWIDKGDCIGCALTDGYVAVLGVCELRDVPTTVSGPVVDWFRKKFGKKGAARDAARQYARGAATALAASSAVPLAAIPALRRLASVLADDGDVVVVDAVPEDPEEAADMMDRLASSLEVAL